MQAARQSGALSSLGFALARPLTNLKDLLLVSCAASYATHGVGDGAPAREGGVPRFYKTVHVKDALDQVRPPAGGTAPFLLAVLLPDHVPNLHCLPADPHFPQGGYQVMLDHRVLRTPARHPLILPSRALALALAAEWEWQLRRIQPFTMPLMSLAATALDEPKPRHEVVATMLQYLPTDSVVCRDEPGDLADLQAQVCVRGGRG